MARNCAIGKLFMEENRRMEREKDIACVHCHNPTKFALKRNRHHAADIKHKIDII